MALGVMTMWVGLGCGSGGGGGGGGGGGAVLDCAFLAGDNCWKTTASAATSCLPPETESGTLSADNKTCTYASGAVVTFATPLVVPPPNNPTWNFTVNAGGQECLHYEEATTFKLTVGGQTVTEGSSGTLGLRISCPDGKSYTAANAFDLLSCGDDAGATFGGLPGSAWSFSGSRLIFGLLSTSSSSSNELQVFDCGK
jgi:hypothetical protein